MNVFALSYIWRNSECGGEHVRKRFLPSPVKSLIMEQVLFLLPNLH